MSQESAAAIDAEFLRRYQSLVGALLYCSGNTRPDVAFAVGMLCRAMSKPTHDLYQDGLRVLSYLHRTRHIGLRYQADAKHLHGQSDSDWGVRHSTSGWQFTYTMVVISWGSKKQISVALSSCEAEIMWPLPRRPRKLRGSCAPPGLAGDGRAHARRPAAHTKRRPSNTPKTTTLQRG